jgi:hypothetical protein
MQYLMAGLRNRRLVTFFLFMMVMSAICVPSTYGAVAYGTGHGWVVRSPLPAGVEVYDVVYAKGTFVAVGAGAAMTSEDGINWDVSTIAGRPTLVEVEYLNNQFVAVGLWGVIVTSTDGVRWRRAMTESFTNLSGIAYGNGRYVAVGENGAAFVSTDGQRWEQHDLKLGLFNAKVIYANGEFITYGMTRVREWDHVATSTNGEDWETTELAGPSTVYVVGVLPDGTMLSWNSYRISASTDHRTWRTVEAKESYDIPIVVGNETFAATESGLLIRGVLSGTPKAIGRIPLAPVDRLALGSDIIVAISHQQLFSSSDSSTWTQISGPSDLSFYGLTSSPDRLVAVGKGGALSASISGQQWQVTRLGEDISLNRVAYDGSRFVAVGGQNEVGLGSVPVVATSPDGVKWTVEQLKATRPGRLLGIAFDGKSTVAVGTTGVIFRTSKSGAWEPQPTATEQSLTGVAFGNNQWVAVGLKNTVLSSTNGEDWAIVSTPYDNSFWKDSINYFNVRFIGGKFIIVGSGGTVLLSKDGLNWVQGDSSTNFGDLWDVAAVNEKDYVFVGTQGAVNHRIVPMPGRNALRAITRVGQRLVAVGAGGLVVENSTLVSCGRMYADVHSDTLGCEQIEMLTEIGILQGYGDGTFRPPYPLTRAEFAKLIVLALGVAPKPAQAADYKDTSDSHWAVKEGYIQAVTSLGLMTGYGDQRFQPDKEIKYGEAIKVLVSALGRTSDGIPVDDLMNAPDSSMSSEAWSYGWYGTAYELGLIGDAAPFPEWGPENPDYQTLSRGGAARLLANFVLVRAKLESGKP